MNPDFENQIRYNFEKAFIDTLAKNINKDPPDIKWLSELFAEIRTKLMNLTPNNKKIQEEICNRLDLELLQQMLLNSAFDMNDLKQLIDYVFYITLQLCAPVRDRDIQDTQKNLQQMIAENKSFGEIVSTFVVHANKIIDVIHEDIRIFHQANQTPEA
tara:strand:- start:1128 stop:1601 length:474 start_codon:yes stop_codon:yes gene_type:complete